MIFPAVFSIVVGIGMLGQWTASFVSGRIPELRTEPIRIWFHIAAECLTAFALITAGVALIVAARFAPTLFFVALGMLFYTAIVSPGYFAQKGQWWWLFMFGVIVVLGIVSLGVVIGVAAG
jgi:hypothetical protein